MCQEKTKSSLYLMRKELLAEAKSWVGTPYLHQACVKGVGVDCVNLIIAVGAATGLLNLTKADLKAFSGYSRLPNPDHMGYYIRKHLLPADFQVGNIVWIQWRENLPMHLAIIGEHDSEPTLIHAYGDVRKVVEHKLTKEWHDKIVSFWGYPGLT